MWTNMKWIEQILQFLLAKNIAQNTPEPWSTKDHFHYANEWEFIFFFCCCCSCCYLLPIFLFLFFALLFVCHCRRSKWTLTLFYANRIIYLRIKLHRDSVWCMAAQYLYFCVHKVIIVWFTRDVCVCYNGVWQKGPIGILIRSAQYFHPHIWCMLVDDDGSSTHCSNTYILLWDEQN